MLNIALFGPPGAGKGTQSQLLIEKYNLAYISTGDILRQEISEGSDLGMQAKSIIDQGGLVSDELIVQLIEKRILMSTNVNGILFDGFPRTLVQAYILDGLLLKLHTELSCMLSLVVPREELIKRVLERGKISGRSDDTEEIIKIRLEEYANKTAPVATYYEERNLYFPIDGVGLIPEVFERVSESVDKTIQKVWFNLVLSGPPGVGKGTQGRLLAGKFNLFYISTGSLLRKEIKNNTAIGQQVKDFMEIGELVPDEIVIKLIERVINQQRDVNGFVFKGFPRTVVQAYILDGLLRRMNMSISYMIEMQAPMLELIKRLSLRSKGDNARPYDMSTDLIVHRLEEYETKTVLVADFYERQNKHMVLNGVGTQDEIFDRLSKSVESVIRKVR
jgi:Adenylate kinase and related kinases